MRGGAGGQNGWAADGLGNMVCEGCRATVGGKAGSPREGVGLDSVRAKLGGEPGPARLLDMMLRAGPWGDGFDDSAEGLSLAALRAIPHALDLGALKARLPELLRTPGRRIDLAPALLVQDVPRLRARLARGVDEGLVLIGRRPMRNMNSWLHNLEALAKGPARCTLLICAADAKRCGLVDGGLAHVRSRGGSVEGPVDVSDSMREGVVSLPHGY